MVVWTVKWCAVLCKIQYEDTDCPKINIQYMYVLIIYVVF